MDFCPAHRDHPRVCGEKRRTVHPRRMHLGSPPRMRGKAVAIFRQLHHGRITPAYAGKRDIPSRGNTQQGDHPRVCGEKPCLLTLMSTTPGSPPRVCGEKTCSCTYKQLQRGSPPRMRGKDPPAAAMQGCPGITPAYAGKRRSSFPAPWCWRDHPRVCGEKRSGAAQSAQT